MYIIIVINLLVNKNRKSHNHCGELNHASYMRTFYNCLSLVRMQLYCDVEMCHKYNQYSNIHYIEIGYHPNYGYG